MNSKARYKFCVTIAIIIFLSIIRCGYSCAEENKTNEIIIPEVKSSIIYPKGDEIDDPRVARFPLQLTSPNFGSLVSLHSSISYGSVTLHGIDFYNLESLITDKINDLQRLKTMLNDENYQIPDDDPEASDTKFEYIANSVRDDDTFVYSIAEFFKQWRSYYIDPGYGYRYEKFGRTFYSCRCNYSTPGGYYTTDCVTFLGYMRAIIRLGSNVECEEAKPQIGKILSQFVFTPLDPKAYLIE